MNSIKKYIFLFVVIVLLSGCTTGYYSGCNSHGSYNDSYRDMDQQNNFVQQQNMRDNQRAIMQGQHRQQQIRSNAFKSMNSNYNY
jgi:hypothetical protein